MDTNAELRKLPKIDRLLEREDVAQEIATHGRDLVVEALRTEVETLRARVLGGEVCSEEGAVIEAIRARLHRSSRPTLRRVINASGVVIHTNLGRAPLSEEAIAAMSDVARGYSNLEYDLDEGERGSRYMHCGELLARLSGAEDGLVVNNNASSVILLLAAFAKGRDVVVSRGQLVEIGGGFRIPDVMRESGASLVEVGTTNRTYASDYVAATNERTAAWMLVHRSNFKVTGFTHDASAEELSPLAREKNVLLIDDLGSGTLLDTKPFGLDHEPTVQERVASGADLVCFSGDKLLGGPQAGYIVGKRALIAKLKKFPMLRALRVDKVTLAGIEATLRHYLKGEALSKVPIWKAISAKESELIERANRWVQALASQAENASVVSTESTVGGGSLPGMTIPTRALAIRVEKADEVAKKLRAAAVPVVARIDEGRLLFDPRTVLPEEDEALLASIRSVLG